MNKRVQRVLAIASSVFFSANLKAQSPKKKVPIVIEDQGSFATGGTVLKTPGTYDPVKRGIDGQTFHGDHAYVFYQIPQNAKKLPLVFWHGIGQFSKT